MLRDVGFEGVSIGCLVFLWLLLFEGVRVYRVFQILFLGFRFNRV